MDRKRANFAATNKPSDGSIAPTELLKQERAGTVNLTE
jgi:hypothetical protein